MTRGPYCFRIHGQIYHRTGCLHPADGNNYRYLQVYILEGDQAVTSRMKIPEIAVADQKLSEKYRKLWRKKAHMLLHTDICMKLNRRK